MYNPKLVLLEGDEEKLRYFESYLGMELTEHDLYDPELMGVWGAIIKGAGKVIKGVGKGIGKMFTARHRRKEAGRVEAARKRILLERAKRKSDYIEKQRMIAMRQRGEVGIRTATIQKQNLNKSLLFVGVPLLGALIYMKMSR